jgi:hypothetical protein
MSLEEGNSKSVSDEEEDDNSPQPQRPKRSRVRASVTTATEARIYCNDLVQRQVELAIERGAPQNQATDGDADVKRVMFMLLSKQAIRSVFLSTARRHEAWPRLRTLFGAPPYSFLLPEDAGIMRATGIASGRVNMSFRTPGVSAGYSQFGGGHYVDSHSREYRMTPAEESDELVFDMQAAPQLMSMSVRVPKKRRVDRITVLRDAEKRSSALFPRVGEVLDLSYAPALQAVWEQADREGRMRVLVKGLLPRGEHASTASLVALKV